jgi:hypothetical protein
VVVVLLILMKCTASWSHVCLCCRVTISLGESKA